MKRSFVYLGLVSFGATEMFVKVGKTDHPEKRVKAYQTHCPGGLSSMYATEVASNAAAYAAEARLLSAIGRIDGAAFVGGEWVKIPSHALEVAFDLLIQLVGEPVSVSLDRGRRVANWG